MTARKIVHGARVIGFLPGYYLHSETRCTPHGGLTRAGWQRLYLVTETASAVTCKKCLKGMK